MQVLDNNARYSSVYCNGLHISQQIEWCNSFIKYFDVFTKIKNNIKKIMQCKKMKLPGLFAGM